MPPDGLSSVGGTCVGDVDEEVDAATVDASLIADGVIMLSGAPGFWIGAHKAERLTRIQEGQERSATAWQMQLAQVLQRALLVLLLPIGRNQLDES